MALYLASATTSKTALRAATSFTRIARVPRRCYADEAAAAAAASEETPKASASSSKVALPPSSCPAGTPMPGLAIYKDRPDILAKPDEEYPPWLWDLLSTSAIKTTSASTELDKGAAASASSSSSSATPATKGELRTKQKRELKERRAAEAAAARRMGNKAAPGEVGPVGRTEILEGRAEVRVRDPAEEEKMKKMALRKENRQKIKGRNFMAGS